MVILVAVKLVVVVMVVVVMVKLVVMVVLVVVMGFCCGGFVKLEGKPGGWSPPIR